MNKKIYAPLIILIVFASLFLSSFVSLRSVTSLIKSNSEEFLNSYSGEIFSAVNNSLNEPYFVAKMIENSFVKNILSHKNNLSGEEIEEQLKSYLAGLNSEKKYDRLFIVDDSTGCYYTEDGLYTVVDPKNIGTDKWYDEFLENPETTTFRLDTTKNKIYVNHKIFDDNGNVLGVCGVGETLEALISDLEKFTESNYFDLKVVSKNGECKLSMNIEECGSPVSDDRIELLKKYDDSKNYIFATNKNDFHLIKKLDASNWYLIIENGSKRFSLYKNLLLLNILICFAIMVAVLLILNFILSKIKKNHAKLIFAEEQQKKIVHSLGDIYHTMHLFDLRENKCYEFSTIKEVHEIYESESENDFQEKMYSAMKKSCSKNHLQGMLEFTNFSTLPERIGNRKYISQEFIGNFNGWIRGSFIKVSDDFKVFLFVTTLIENDKKREEQLIKISKTDQLTRLYNRRAYEEDVAEIEKNRPENLVLISIDVNGLKTANDTLGHAAGDELIMGAANTMLESLKPFGKVYRTGGDEFMALLQCSEDEAQAAVKKMEDMAESWSGQIVKKLAMAKGLVICSKYGDKSIEEIQNVADQLMYEDKAAYYERTGIKRRKQ